VTDLSAFIAARLDEDEKAARDADGPWTAYARRYFNEESEEFGSIRSAFYWLADNDYCEKHVPERIVGPDGTVVIDSDTMAQLDKGSLDEKQHAFETWLRQHHALLGADLARVLREVQAKRRVMERHCPGMRTRGYVYCQACPDDRDGFPEVPIDECPELRDLAVPYSDHPDYRKEWAA
jgi:hypothetical protein